MVQVNAETKFSEITIQGLTFNVPEVYGAGHVLTENEAGQLNQVLGENLRNNFASTVKAAREDAAKANEIAVDDVTTDHLDVEELERKFNDYVAEYEFGQRRAGGGVRAPADPVEREALNIARAKVREAIKAKGFNLSEVSKEKIQELAAGLIERYPAIKEEAQRRVDATKSIALESLDIEKAA